MSFSKEFLFGVSSSSYQIEGGFNEDGKGEDMWDRLLHTNPDMVPNRENGDIACDSYHKYKEDVSIIKEIGFQVYRFSVSWARVLPDGETTNINELGINYYHNLIDELLSNGIEPMVTINHFDLPQRLQDMGGWINPLMADYFKDYADLLFQRFGHKVKWWITINEPLQLVQGYCSDRYAPALKLKSNSEYLVGHTLLKAHAKAYRLYDQCYRDKQKGKISIALNCRAYLPKTESQEDKEAAYRAYLFELFWFAHPIYSENGDYPGLMKKIVNENSKKEGRNKSRLPEFTEEEIKEIKGTWDYFSFNFYTSCLVTTGKCKERSFSIRDLDANVIFSSDPSWHTSDLHWLKRTPHGFYDALRTIKEEYNNPPVFVCENGYCDNSPLVDKNRILYHKVYLEALLNAVEKEGCNIIGYLAWSLYDNFEWFHGYGSCFGVVEVDFTDPGRKRTPKLSSKFFKKLISSRQIPNDTDNFV